MVSLGGEKQELAPVSFPSWGASSLHLQHPPCTRGFSVINFFFLPLLTPVELC